MFSNIQLFAQWLSLRLIGKPVAKLWYKFYAWYGHVAYQLDYINYKLRGVRSVKIAIVGDLSMQDPARLDKAMAAAMNNCDLLVHVGDVHPGYEVMKKYIPSGKVFVVPGNHDQDYASLNMPRQWLKVFDNFVIVGVDNSADKLDNEAWGLLKQAEEESKINRKSLFVVAHKPISTVILPNGLENNHIMGESGYAADVKPFQEFLYKQKDVLLIVGHYHEKSYQRTWYSDVLIEGRGGSAPMIGYTLIIIQKEGWVFRQIDLGNN
jgi:predicted phosphodiesterase